MWRRSVGMRVRVEAVINPTEDPEKVERAVRNVVGEVMALQTVKSGEFQMLVGEGEGLECLRRLKHLLKVRMIRDAAREAMMRSISGNTLTVHLNRHAAYAGKASFTEPHGECPLGPITITVECEKPEEVVEWLTEKEA